MSLIGTGLKLPNERIQILMLPTYPPHWELRFDRKVCGRYRANEFPLLNDDVVALHDLFDVPWFCELPDIQRPIDLLQSVLR